MRLEAAILVWLISYSQANLKRGESKLEEKQIATNFYLGITLHFSIIITNCEKRFLTYQQYRSALTLYLAVLPLANARRFYSSMGDLLANKVLTDYLNEPFLWQCCLWHFTLAINARRFYSSMGDLLANKGLSVVTPIWPPLASVMHAMQVRYRNN